MKMQHDHLGEKRDDIAETMDALLRHSPLKPYFETFKIDKAAAPAPRPLQTTDPEYYAKKAQYEGDFRARHGILPSEVIPMVEPTQGPFDSSRPPSPAPENVMPYNTYLQLQRQHQREVGYPLENETVNRGANPEGNKGTDPAREKYRKRLTSAYFAAEVFRGSFQHTPKEADFADQVQVRDGKIFIDHYKNGEFREEDYHRQWFALYEVLGLNDSAYYANAEYAARALEIIMPKLWDKTDTRDFDTIVDTSITDAAKQLAEKIVTDEYYPLSSYLIPTWRHMWLTDTTGPTVTDADLPRLEHTGPMAPRPRVSESVWTSSAESLHRDEGNTIAEILYARPDVFESGPRMVTARSKNTELPKFPEHATDLVLDCVGTELTQFNWSVDKESDPYIYGMKLVARDGNRAYFVKDAEDPKYQKIEADIPYIKKLLVTEYIANAGMQGVADAIEGMENISVDQLLELMRGHMKYDVTEKGVNLDIGDAQMWKQLIDDDGNLTGQSKVFAAFTQGILQILYPSEHPASVRTSVRLQYGHLLNENKKVTRRSHYQVELDSEPKGINAIVDLAPDDAEFQAQLAAFPVPPPHALSYGFRYEHGHDEYTEKEHPEYLRLLPKDEYKDLLHQSAGEIIFAEAEVFADTKQRLFSKVRRDEDIPLPNMSTMNDTVLRVKSSDLADPHHDPAIAGMKLIARKGDEYDFALDTEHNPYAPVLLQIPDEKRLEIAAQCQAIGMTRLSEELYNSPAITIEGLRQLVRDNAKYSIPDEGKDYFPVQSIDDLARNEMIDENGILNGQCDTFEFFMRSLVAKIYGEAAVSAEGGISLRNTGDISQAMHAQTRLTLPENGIHALLDVEPLHYNIPDLNEGSTIVETPPEEEEMTADRQIRFDVPETDEDTAELLQRLVQAAPPATPRVEEVLTAQTPEVTVNEVESTEEAVTETKDDVKQMAKLELSIPEPVAEKEQEDEKLQDFETQRHLESSLRSFRMALENYLGIQRLPNEYYRDFDRRIIEAMGPTLKRGEDIWTNTLHVQLFVMARKYYAAHDPIGPREEYTYPAEDISRMQRWVGYYKDRNSGIWPMIRNGKFPMYDERFLNTMDQAFNAFAEWGKTQQAEA